MNELERIRAIWNQQTLPILLRREQQRLRCRVPYVADDILWIGNTQRWLRNGRHSIPDWHPEGKFWEVPAAWLGNLITQMLNHYGKFYLIQPYRALEVCADKCWKAKGHDCQCSRMGANHGQGKHGHWLEISDTFAVRWGDAELACRLLKNK